ncbi:MAG: isochorismatase family cysteine hydrolase [Candidatus Woesearchaeota archaeon]
MAKAVVIVDMLNDFVQENGALPVPGAKSLVENIGKIRGKANAYNVLVVYANDAHSPNDPEFKTWPRHAVKGESGAKVIDELLPAACDLVIEKQEMSMFTNKDADKLLRSKGIDELYVVGVATEYCVRAAALGAASLGYKVNVVVDAISGVDIKKGDSTYALLEMGKAGVLPKYTSQVLEEMVR